MAKSVDLVYDRLVAGNKIRSSDKYEALTAIVFSLLDDSPVTVQDMRLLGSTGVRHQIDAVVGDGAGARRILVECKDYTKKAGLPLIRNFWAAVEDLAPDEAFVVTTVGFTKPAVKYAAAKGIRLALLRPPEGDDDWANLVREINVSMQYSVPVQEPQVEWMVPDDQPEVLAAWSGGGLVSAESVELVHADGTTDTVHSLAAKYVRVPAPGTAGIALGEETFSDRSVLRVAGQPDLQVTGFKWQQRFEVAVHQFTVGDGIGGLTSELMLRTLDGSVHRIFSNRDLAAWTLDASGRVVPKP